MVRTRTNDLFKITSFCFFFALSINKPSYGQQIAKTGANTRQATEAATDEEPRVWAAPA